MSQPEMAAKGLFQTIKGGKAFAVFFESADPVFPFCVLWQPSTRRCNQQYSSWLDPFVY